MRSLQGWLSPGIMGWGKCTGIDKLTGVNSIEVSGPKGGDIRTFDWCVHEITTMKAMAIVAISFLLKEVVFITL